MLQNMKIHANNIMFNYCCIEIILFIPATCNYYSIIRYFIYKFKNIPQIVISHYYKHYTTCIGFSLSDFVEAEPAGCVTQLSTGRHLSLRQMSKKYYTYKILKVLTRVIIFHSYFSSYSYLRWFSCCFSPSFSLFLLVQVTPRQTLHVNVNSLRKDMDTKIVDSQLCNC